MRLLVFIIAITMAFTSCKKNASPVPIITDNSTILTTGYTYGSMATVYYQYYTGNSYSGSDSAVSSFFFTDPLNPSNTTIDAGSISFNSNTLNNTSNLYKAYSLNIHQANSVWTVSGNSDVPAINYTITPNYPIFSGNAQLPDSFSISNGLNFNLTGISNHPNSSIFLQINDFTNSVYRSLGVNQTVCSFSEAELAVFQPNSTVFISLNLSNSVIQNFNGKNYAFTSSLNHMKSGVLVKP
ncbi:MAG: hypothetical protein V4565_04375 [Bacteroidota bacterium]